MAAPQLPSDRSFGLLFTTVFAVVAAWTGWKGNALWTYFAIASGIFLLLSLTRPQTLHALNVLWMRFGALLNKVVSPIVLGVIYFGLVTPIALLFKVRGRDALHRKFDRELASYWVKRDPPGPDGPSSFPRQF